MYDKILVPLDGSPVAESVLPWVESLATRMGSELVLVTVGEIPSDRFGQSRGPGMHMEPLGDIGSVHMEEVSREPATHREYLEQAVEHMEAEVKRYLATMEASLREKGISVSSVVLFGHAAEQIVDYAEQAGIDLIAMATHGRSGVRRWMYGSVAEKVLHAATVPVLLTRAPQGTEGSEA